jgi:hypothetical protein
MGDLNVSVLVAQELQGSQIIEKRRLLRKHCQYIFIYVLHDLNSLSRRLNLSLTEVWNFAF